MNEMSPEEFAIAVTNAIKQSLGPGALRGVGHIRSGGRYANVNIQLVNGQVFSIQVEEMDV